MKIAFLCEGKSEYESVCVIFNKVLKSNFQFIQEWHENVPADDKDRIFIYRHNYKGLGKIRKEYFNFSTFLINKAAYDKVFVWFDNDRLLPVCQYVDSQKELIGDIYANKIELLISVEAIENWYLSNKEILDSFLGLDITGDYLSSLKVQNFLTLDCVDSLNANKILSKIKKGTEVERYSKQKLATRFFSFVDLIKSFNSSSFTRFISKIRLLC